MLFLPCAHAQIEGLRVDTAWHNGNVLLYDNTILNGYFQFDNYSAIVAYKENLEGEVDSFDKSKVMAMQLYDSEHEEMRRFARLEYTSRSGEQTNALCEFVMETNTFFVLSEHFLRAEGKLVQARTVTPGSAGMPYGAPTTVNRGHSLNERIFFMAKESDQMEEVLFVPKMIFIRKRSMFAGVDAPIFNEEVMEKYLKAYLPEIKTYMKANKIKLKKYIYEDAKVRDELFQVLGYYVRLERGEW